MSTTDSSAPRQRPHFSRPSGAARFVAATAAVLISASLLGGLLVLFEWQGLQAGGVQTAGAGTTSAQGAA